MSMKHALKLLRKIQKCKNDWAFHQVLFSSPYRATFFTKLNPRSDLNQNKKKKKKKKTPHFIFDICSPNSHLIMH